jgi:hypothetical protein
MSSNIKIRSESGSHRSLFQLLCVFLVTISCLSSSANAIGVHPRPTRVREVDRDLGRRRQDRWNARMGRGFVITLHAAIWDKKGGNKKDNDSDGVDDENISMVIKSEEELLQAQLNEITSADDLPLFSLDFDSNAFENGKLPLPAFTASLVFLSSTILTIYLFYIGMNGFD